MTTLNAIRQHTRRPLFAALGGGVATIALISAVTFADNTSASSEADAAVAAQAVGVTIVQPTVQRITEWNEYTGRFQATDRVDVRARVGGALVETAFEEGQIVEQGDILFRIDPRPFENELAAAKATFAGAGATLKTARAANERGQSLVDRNALSHEEAERRENDMRQAEADWAAAKARVDQAELNLEFTEVRAPISGRISDDFVTVGNLIVGGDAGGTLLTTIVSVDPIEFTYTGSESDYLAQLRANEGRAGLGQNDAPVHVRLMDEPAFDREGRASFIDNELDPSTGTMRGKAVFANADGALLPGMFGRIRLAAGEPRDAILLPDSAIQSDQSEKFVWVDDNGTARRAPVTLGPAHGELRVIRSGIDADTPVIVAGVHLVRDGVAVAAIERPDRVAAAARQN